MAGDYLPMRLDLDEDPAVIHIAHALDVDELDVVGRLWKLWAWGNKQLRDGNAPGVTPSWIDRYTRMPGLATAMSGAGWLDISPDGVAIPNFDRWNSNAAKKRLETNRRVSKHREMKRERNGNGVTKSVTKEEKRREEKRRESDHLCSWNGRAVEISHLKDWCTRTFGGIAEGRGQKQLSLEPLTRDLLFRVGVLRLCDVVSEAFVEHGCEGLRKVKRWPANPGGWLRTTWSGWEHAPANLNQLLGEVELPDGI